jgi:hypothetical protein
MAPKKIKTHKDSLKRPCFQCCVTKVYCNRAYLFEDKVFATPLIAYFYFNTIAKLKKEEKEAILYRLFEDSHLQIKGDFDNELTIEQLLILNSREDSENGIEASWDQECLVTAELYEKIQEESAEDDTFEDEKPAKIKSYVYVLEEDTVTELTQLVGQPLNQFLPPRLFYYGEKTLVHKNRDISVTVYVEINEDLFGYKNELFSKYFGQQEQLVGKVYVHSFSHLPMMESANAALDKEMEKMEVEEEVKERKKKARVPRKKVAKAIEQLHASEPGSAEEKEAVQELQEVAKAKKKRSPKRKISAEVLPKEVSEEVVAAEEVKEPSPKRVKKTAEEKEAEKKAKEEAKEAKAAAAILKKQAKEEEKAKRAAEREAKKKEKEDKKVTKRQE